MRCRACSTRSRLVVRPAIKSRSSWATVHMGREDSMRVTSFLFGGNCFLCRGGAGGLLCAACEADLPRLPALLCPRCALPSPGGVVCGRCLTQQPAYDATFAALSYDFPADA